MLKIKKSLTVLIVLGIVCAAMPYAVNIPAVQKVLKQKFNRTGLPVTFDRLAWQWLPHPAILFYNVGVVYDPVDVTAPVGGLRPDWFGLIHGKSAVEVYLEQPNIIVTSLAGPNDATNGTKNDKPENRPDASPAAAQRDITLPPLLAIEIERARLSLPSDGFLTPLAQEMDRTEISDLNAKILVTPNRFELTGTCHLPFIETLQADIACQKQQSKTAPGPENYWTLDINGTELDLTAARKKALLLFGEHETTRDICNIVRAGRAKKVGFKFRGFTEDREYLKNMVITADVDEVEAILPETRIPLFEGAGRIKINQAVLTGESLSATTGKTRGTNGRLYIELVDPNPILEVDVDVDVAMTELSDLLSKHVFDETPDIVAELEKINIPTGRINGHLNISGREDYLPVKFIVKNADSEISYQRFRDPISIKRGTLAFYPDRFLWQGISGQIGPNLIDNSSGAVVWRDNIRLNVDDLDAEIVTENILAQLKNWPDFKKAIKPIVTSLAGPLKIANAQVSGPITAPGQLTWKADVKTTDLDIDSPLLPEPIHIRAGRTQLTSGDVLARDCRLDIDGPNVDLTVDMEKIARTGPNTWIDSQGSLTVQGRITPVLAQWVKEKQWVPPEYFPRTPCLFDPMRFSFNKDGLQMKGRLITPQAGGQDITTTMDIELFQKGITINKLTVAAPKESAALEVVFTPLPDANIYLNFEGRLNKATLDTILENNMLLADVVQGNCRIKYFLDNPSAHQLGGSLLIKGMNIYVGDHVFNIIQAALSSHESQVSSLITIDKLTFAFNREKMDVAGKIALRSGTGLAADLSLQSNKLSVDNLTQMLALFKSDPEEAPAASQAHNKSVAAAMAVTGQIDIDINRLVYKTPYVWRYIKGRIILDPEYGPSATIDQASICGISTTGTLHRPPGKSTINVVAGQVQPVDFQKAMACFDLDNKKLTGHFTLDARLSGTPDNWSSGHVRLISHDGEIKKLAIMSKIFSLINVTDMLSLSGIRNLFSTGYPYSTMQLTGTISDNKLTLVDSFIKGVGMDFFFSGPVDLTTGKLDVLMVVKPFGTIDAIVTSIPLVGKDLGAGNQSIMFLPLTVSGDIRDPKVNLIATTQ